MTHIILWLTKYYCFTQLILEVYKVVNQNNIYVHLHLKIIKHEKKKNKKLLPF